MLDEIVITDGNKEAFELILHLTDTFQIPVRALVYGPAGSGKSTLLRGKARTRDLLSEKEFTACNAAEVVSLFNIGSAGESFLEKIGTADALVIDEFQRFYDDENGIELCRLLVSARNKAGYDTVIVSDVPFDELDMSLFDDIFADYGRLSVSALDDDGRAEFARRLLAKEDESSSWPLFEESAIDCIVGEYAKDASEIRKIAQFFKASDAVKEAERIDANDVRSLLGSPCVGKTS